jgi:gas vesicle protein
MFSPSHQGNETRMDANQLNDLHVKKTLSLYSIKDTMSDNKWSNKYTTFAVGIVVGALLALPFAPSSGEGTRDYISSAVKKGIEDAASTGKRWKRRAKETVDDVKSTVAGAVEAGQEAYRSVRDAQVFRRSGWSRRRRPSRNKRGKRARRQVASHARATPTFWLGPPSAFCRFAVLEVFRRRRWSAR